MVDNLAGVVADAAAAVVVVMMTMMIAARNWNGVACEC